MSDIDDNASSSGEQEHELDAGLADDAAAAAGGGGGGGGGESEDEGLFGEVGKGEELFFDEDMDTKDADFVRRVLHRNFSGKMPPRPPTLDPKVAEARSRSDAILSCPCCFSIVTIDCQRHSRCVPPSAAARARSPHTPSPRRSHRNQYRAMFVQNCVVDKLHFLPVRHARPLTSNRNRIRLNLHICRACGGVTRELADGRGGGAAAARDVRILRR